MPHCSAPNGFKAHLHSVDLSPEQVAAAVVRLRTLFRLFALLGVISSYVGR